MADSDSRWSNCRPVLPETFAFGYILFSRQLQAGSWLTRPFEAPKYQHQGPTTFGNWDTSFSEFWT